MLWLNRSSINLPWIPAPDGPQQVEPVWGQTIPKASGPWRYGNASSRVHPANERRQNRGKPDGALWSQAHPCGRPQAQSRVAQERSTDRCLWEIKCLYKSTFSNIIGTDWLIVGWFIHMAVINVKNTRPCMFQQIAWARCTTSDMWPWTWSTSTLKILERTLAEPKTIWEKLLRPPL